MAVQVLRPGSLSAQLGASPAGTPPDIVGSDAWADDSDSTYATMYQATLPTHPSGVGGDLDVLTVDPSLVTGISVTIRGYATGSSGGSDAVPTVRVLPDPTSLFTQTMFSVGVHDPVPFTFPLAATTVTLEYPDDYWGGLWPLVTIAEELADGAFVYAGANTTPSFTIIEFAVNVSYQLPNPPPLRRYPRSDGLGVGPTRHYPPPQSRRLAGGIR